MRQDIAYEIHRLKKNVMLMNKSELARRIGCNRRVIGKSIKEPIRDPAVPKSESRGTGVLFFSYMGFLSQDRQVV